MDIDDDGKLRMRFTNKKFNAAKEGHGFSLTWEQWCSLIREAGVVSSQLGNRGHQLARCGDAGGYEIGNCRFIHYKENVAEKKISDAAREASRRNAAIMQAKRSEYPEDVRRSWCQSAVRGGERHRRINPQETLETNGLLAERMRRLSESDINVGEWGWITAASRLLGCSHTHVRRMVDRYEKMTGAEG